MSAGKLSLAELAETVDKVQEALLPSGVHAIKHGDTGNGKHDEKFTNPPF